MKQKITGFLRDSLVAYFKPYGKTLQRAVQIITAPCCGLTIDSIDVDCVTTGEYDITVVLNESIGFLGKGTAQIVVDGVVFAEGVITEPKTIVFEGVLITAGSYDVDIKIFLPTDSNETIGAYKVLPTEESVTFAAC
mgnify:CR=1 FL=1